MCLAALLAGCQASIGQPGGGSDAAGSQADARQRADATVAVDAVPPPDATPCVEGDQQVTDPATGHCYMVFRTLTSWQNARVACEQLGGYLAVSTSQIENDLFSPLAGLTDVWVGGNDIAIEMTWVWVNDEPLTYTNWRMGEPNNSGPNGTSENCMIIEGDNAGLWDDRACASEYGYVCERN